jgi:hypothetical protein
MIERSYIDGKFKAGRRSFNIYCTVCDSLVFIRENTIECASDHLNKCITRTIEKNLTYSIHTRKNVKKEGALIRKSVSSLSSVKVDEIYLSYCFIFKKGLKNYTYEHSNENKKRIVNRLINKVRVIQQAWRSYKKRPASFASQIWNALRNDGTTDEEKFLDGDWVQHKKIQLFVRFHKVSVKMIENSEYYHRQVTAYLNKSRGEIIRLVYSHFGMDNYIYWNESMRITV